MKRVVPILLIIMLILSLSACGEPVEVVQTPAPTVEPAYTFTEAAYPYVMGGAALSPLGNALAAVMLGRTAEEVSGLGSFGSTAAAYEALAAGSCALVLAVEPKEAVPETETAEIARDALVFVVSQANPVSDLTAEQIAGIYSGDITDWFELGGDAGAITAFQRSAASGAQWAMEELVMAGAPMAEAPLDYFPSEDEDGVAEAVAAFDGGAGAIGYTTLYYAEKMGMAEGYKIISVDGVMPSGESVSSGEYGYILSYTASILSNAAQRSPERLLWEWLQCDAGQSLVSHCGYTAVREG